MDIVAGEFLAEFGTNDWLAEEMLERYRIDPASVSDNWRRYFESKQILPRFSSKSVKDGLAREIPANDSPAAGDDLKEPPPAAEQLDGASTRARTESHENRAPLDGQESAGANGKGSVKLDALRASANDLIGGSDGTTRLRGAALALAKNMASSLEVPTATSVRTVAAKALEVNRQIINNQLSREGRPKLSFGHIIAWAVVKGAKKYPRMAARFVPSMPDGGEGVVVPEKVNLGIAVDVEKPGGERSLLVPVIQGASELVPGQFFEAYDRQIAKVRSGGVSPEDFQGANMTITNPGGLGTEHSIPRLMKGQGSIIGVGAITYPAEFSAADPRTLSELGVSKTVTLTSTYDHRVIQGAESGRFLGYIAELLQGYHGFYEEIFEDLEVAYPAVGWSRDRSSVLSVDRERTEKQIHVQTLINNYRVRGHLLAHLDPLGLSKPQMSPELDPASYGLTIWDLTRVFLTDKLAGTEELELEAILSILRDTYCRSIGYEYMHIQSPEEKRWWQRRIEGVEFSLSKEEQLEVLATLNDAEAFEKFLSTRYIGQKRFGLEGAESAIVFLREVLNRSIAYDLTEAVIGMAHRGRLNVLANIVGKSYRMIFEEFEGNLDPNSVQGSGDVKYHKGFKGIYRSSDGREIPVTLASNPSHLEAVDPVVEGMVRAIQDLKGNLFEFKALAVLIHGDASFSGQGVVAETLNLSQLPGYRIGGTIHFVINNQLGFTTNPQEARSSLYTSDIAKMIQAPIMHVNGDDPEAVVRCARLALDYRNTFHKDVVVDMVCYRRHGHNEGDEPSYTQPIMYKVIEEQPSTRRIYLDRLVASGAISREEGEKALDSYLNKLATALAETRQSRPPSPVSLPPAPPRDVILEPLDTKVKREELDYLEEKLYELPDGFELHPKLVKQFEARRELYRSGVADWALSEAFAFGTIMLDGRDVRIAGQDTRRGTFSHRHAALYDYKTGEMYQPLARIREERPPVANAEIPGRFMIYDSLLSEYAAMGFEYGYSLINTDALTIWEAQFGDFSNGAQIIIDQFLAAAADKWNQHSGLTLFLPHGYEGQGPEHSSARLERFLALAAGANMTVVNPSTGAQFFHLLRAQVLRKPPRPLIVATPKSLLRAKQSRSRLDEFTSSCFQPVLDDVMVDHATVRRIVLASGKVAYDAMASKEQAKVASAIVRVEQLHPWPRRDLDEVLSGYPQVEEIIWLQEEPENMGAWPTAREHLAEYLERGLKLKHVTRVAAGSPATGSAAMHALEQKFLIEQALFEPL
jgi:2-oxoglutarate dehydrogenase E1 component